MTEEQLSALLAKISKDAAFRDRLKDARDVDVFIEIVKEAGYEVSAHDWAKLQDMQLLDLDDDDLIAITGGAFPELGKIAEATRNMNPSSASDAADRVKAESERFQPIMDSLREILRNIPTS